MVEFTGTLGRALDEVWGTAPLLAVPVVLTFLSFDAVRRVLAFEGFHVGIKFVFPEDVPTLWSFVSLPQAPGSGVSPVGILLLFLGALIGAYLSAGYLGSIKENLERGDFDFMTNAGRFFLDFLWFRLLLSLFELLLILAGLVLGPLIILALPVVLFISYLIYGVPYIIVSEGMGFEGALRKSVGLALTGGEYLEYGLKYLAFVALVSIPMTIVTVDFGLPGLVAGVLVSPFVSLVLSTATMTFFLEDEGRVSLKLPLPLEELD